MTYAEFIEFNRHTDQGPYKHKHHIIPLSKGGADNNTNIIELSWLAHYYAHYLLAKENPDNEEYQRDFKKKGSIDNWLCWCYKVVFPSEGTKQKISASMQGKNVGKTFRCSEETKKKMSESHKGKPAWNKGKHYHLSEEHKQHISASAKGRKMPPVSEETRKKLSEAMKKSWANRK